jgi:dihydrofolate reductase
MMITTLGENMRLSLIAALTPARVIGKNNQLPWYMPADLHYFRQVTLGKPVIMGRKTYESIGKPLPGRKNIIISRNKDFSAPPVCQVFDSLSTALQSLSAEPDVFIIGGGEIFAAALPQADFLYVTFIETDIAGDAYFPAWEANQWQEIWRKNHGSDDKNPYPYSFVVLEKKRKK